MAAALRWARLDPGKQLQRRPDSDLPFVTVDQLAGQPLLLDTCVYIHQMKGQAPVEVQQLIETRHVNHSTVAMQELLHTVGRLDPLHPGTAGVINAIQTQIEAMPEHRVVTPDAEMLGRAAMLSGMLSRLQGYTNDRQLKALQDATIFLQAQKLGYTLLTANIIEHDLMSQLIPMARVLFYRV